MGKCKIISHDGDALYTVQMLPDFTLIEAEIAKLTAQLSDIDNVELVRLQAAYDEVKALTDATQAILDASIAIYAASPTAQNLATVQTQTEALGEAVKLEAKVKAPLDETKARKLRIEKRILRLVNANSTPSPVQLWCTDLSDGETFRQIYAADDEVGTIELNGQDQEGQILQPNYSELGLWTEARDGELVPAISMIPATYFYNRAMMPPWQKWQFLYRMGTITGVTGGGGFDVTLDDTRSFEQPFFIPVNDLDSGLLTGVTAEYMNCNEAAFTVSDHVVIKSTYDVSRNRTDVIIGFVDNPQPCDLNGFNYHPNVIGGTQPGFHDWQNLQPAASPSWIMNTPVLTDVITDGTGSDMRDWKGYLTGGEKVLAQWEHRGDFIYINGVKMATTPTFTLTAATGDVAGPLVPGGFYAAWVTKDFQYIYAVPWELGGSRHVLRKTNIAELTGVAYNVTTAPNGWEVSAAFGPTSYTDFTFFGVPAINESGTEGRAMDAWTHGAKRTPQLDPGAGAVWYSPAQYFDDWLEESQITIATPSAATIAAAGIVHQFNGLLGGGMWLEDTGYDNTIRSGKLTCGGTDYYLNGERVIYGKLVFSGEVYTSVGFQGDVAGYVKRVARGEYERTVTLTNDNICLACTLPDISGRTPKFGHTRVTTAPAEGHGVFIESDFDSWSIPGRVTVTRDDSFSFVMSTPVCGEAGELCSLGVLTETVDESVFNGVFEKTNVSDSIHRIIQKEARLTRDAAFDHPVTACEGTVTVTTRQWERGILELGTTEKTRERLFNEVIDGPNTVPIDIGFAAAPAMGGPYGPDPDNGPPTPVSIKRNIVGFIYPASSITSRWIRQEAAKDHNGNYISWDHNTYNVPLTSTYEHFLTNGDLSILDELDNGTGTEYQFPHVANSL